MKITSGRAGGKPSEQRSDTFTGEVWADPVLLDAEGLTVNNVFFAPGARTHWHFHDRGQVLHVLAGEGRAGLRGGEPQMIRAGDVVFFEPGEEHWHGAAQGSYMLHLAISLGSTNWLDPVADAEYGGGS